MATHTITTADEIVVSLGKDRTIAVGTQRLTNEVVAHVFAYGLRQILNDAHASEKDGELKVALAEKRLQTLYNGKVRQGSGPRTGDPVAREAKRLAIETLNAFLRSKGKTRADVADDKWAAALARGIEASTPRAKRNVEAAAKATDGVDIEF